MEGLFHEALFHSKLSTKQLKKKKIKSDFRDGSIFSCKEGLKIPRFSSDLDIRYYCLQVDFKVA